MSVDFSSLSAWLADPRVCEDLPKFVLVLIGVICIALNAWRAWQTRGHKRGGQVLELGMQALAFVLFYALLFPPGTAPASPQATQLTLIALGASAEQIQAALMEVEDQPALTLPDTQAPQAIRTVPDLASAFRLWPQIRKLNVVGWGLSARDLEAIPASMQLRFAPTPVQGIVELHAAPRTLLGTPWPVTGRVRADDHSAPNANAQTPASTVELLDPAGAVAAQAQANAQGEFAFTVMPRVSGNLQYRLRWQSPLPNGGSDEVSVPVRVVAGQSLKLSAAFGAPGAEQKYWQRWAADAGLKLTVRTQLSDQINLNLSAVDTGNAASAPVAPASWTPQALGAQDLAVIDERAWLKLSGAEKAAMRNAVSEGLGLLLKPAARPDASVWTEWQALGLPMLHEQARGAAVDQEDGELDTVHLPSYSTAAPALDFHVVPLIAASTGNESSSSEPVIQGQPVQPLLKDEPASAQLGIWIEYGQGRIGLMNVVDSYQLKLSGDEEHYGALWSQVISTLARPQPRKAEPAPYPIAWVGEREVLCDLSPGTQLVNPNGAMIPVLIDHNHCAAWWPSMAGVHQLLASADKASAEIATITVRGPEDGKALYWEQRQQLLQALAAARSDQPVQITTSWTRRILSAQLVRWALFISWLVVMGWLWRKSLNSAAFA